LTEALLRRCAVLAAGLLALDVATSQAAPAPSTATEQTAERQILVMLRLPPDHHRPSATYGGDYGDQATVTVRLRLARNIARRYGLEFVGEGWQMPLLGVDCYLMRAPPGETAVIAMKRIAGVPEIVWSEPMHVYQGRYTF
jgi:hypothetical protein